MSIARPEQDTLQAIQNHTNTLQRLIDNESLRSLLNTDTDSALETYKAALRVLRIMARADDELTRCFTEDEIDALLSVPAITDDWPTLVKYAQQLSMCDELQEEMSKCLKKMAMDRHLRIHGEWAEDNSEAGKAKLERIKQSNKENIHERHLLEQLCTAISSVKDPVPEFAIVKSLIDGLIHNRPMFRRLGGDEDYLTEFLRIVANAKDPKRVIHQTRCYFGTLTELAPFGFQYEIDELAKGKEHFNKVVSKFRSTEQAATREQAVGTTSKLGRFGNSNSSLQSAGAEPEVKREQTFGC